MKRFVLWICVAAALSAQAATSFPDIGDARLVVLANNLQNYYYYYAESSRPSYNTDEGLAEKTHRIMEMMIESNADIFAFCEVEAKPIVLDQLVDSLNTAVGEVRYATEYDYIYQETDSYDNAIKSGFVYRKDKVKPYGSNTPATNVTYYRNVMRIQAWEELSTGERFTLSMNHFKAMSDDASRTKRVDNATWLVNGLANSSKVKDPDILIMGDLNAQMSEECIAVIENKGYEEQLLRFDSSAYSYVYYSSYELIDHAFANSTMASQITGAVVWHTNTSVYYKDRYSDHDAVVVGLQLGNNPQAIDEVEQSVPTRKILHRGRLLIERNGMQYLVTGQRVR